MAVDRRQLAYDYFKEGYSCAQSVVASFADVLPLDKETLIKVASAFGAGFGRTRNLCGAVSGMGIIIGLLHSDESDIAANKGDVYKIVQIVDNAFKERNGSDQCWELLKNVKNVTTGYVPQVRDEEYYKARPCIKFVLDAVEIIEEKFLKTNNN